MQGLTHLPLLRLLELGANRLRALPPTSLSSLPLLEELWLGRNKLTAVPDLSFLPALKKLSIQSNRLESLDEDGVGRCLGLEELYASHNGVGEGRGGLRGLKALVRLRVLDVTKNVLEGAEGVEGMEGLEEFWMGDNAVKDWARLEGLRGKKRLTCVYLEGNPVAKEEGYERRAKNLLPQLTQLDANEL